MVASQVRLSDESIDEPLEAALNRGLQGCSNLRSQSLIVTEVFSLNCIFSEGFDLFNDALYLPDSFINGVSNNLLSFNDFLHIVYGGKLVLDLEYLNQPIPLQLIVPIFLEHLLDVELVLKVLEIVSS